MRMRFLVRFRVLVFLCVWTGTFGPAPSLRGQSSLAAARMSADGTVFNSLAFVLRGGDERSWLVAVSPDGRLPDDSPELRDLNRDRTGPLVFLGAPVTQQAGRAALLYFPVEPDAPGVQHRQRFDAGKERPGDSFAIVWSRKDQTFARIKVRVETGVVTLPDVKEAAECVGAPLLSNNRVCGVITGPTRDIRAWNFAPVDLPKKERAPGARLASGRHSLPVVPLDRDNTRVPLSVAPERPCVTIHGVTGKVVFRGRTTTQDKEFNMTDPAFRAAVRERRLDQLIQQPGYVRYTPHGTLTIPVKVIDFPLLGQDLTGTCWVAHYREWLFYYLGTRQPFLPALEDLESYLNLLLTPPTVTTLLTENRAKNAVSFAGGGLRVRKEGRQMLKHLSDIYGLLLRGETATEDGEALNPEYHEDRFDWRAREVSEAAFGPMMNELLLGNMVLGQSEDHVMNILGFEKDSVSICTWGREYGGTLRQLAQADPRGPVLAPIRYESYAMVARGPDGRVMIPPLVPRAADRLDGPRRQFIERYNRGR